MPVSQEVLDEIALTRAEYDLIVERLGREPNAVELGMFGALWSEHCGYKHSRPLLRMFSHTSPAVLSEAGAENAGAVDIGDGLAVVFKVESHNHPSAVEPFQGAATGVGGIVRDILAMGARPIALLNSLRFGPLNDPEQGGVNRHLFSGVVRGISWYGNCIGVPDVGGEIYFHPSYSRNPLVNAMCIGLISKDRLASAAARVPGSVLLLAGSDTGRDGIHGASGLASRAFPSDSRGEEAELRPTVQVGNPFLEKSLIEACLEALDTGAVLAVQDLGAAGLTSASIESAARAGRGIRLDLAQVHRREAGMNAYEVMLSESQERMLLAALPERVGEVQAVFERWDVDCREIGSVIAEPEAQVFNGPEPVARLPIRPLSEAPAYRLEGKPSDEDSARREMPLSGLPLPECGPAQTLLRLLKSPNIASKRPVYRQYDHQVQTNTVAGPGDSDAAVLRIKGTRKAVAVAVDGNGRLCFLDPFAGGQIAVAEACRNISCTGARPLALTDCLNFGNPLRPEIYYQLEECIRGMALASEKLDAPVVSGNVSLFNETRGQAVHPTPVVGALGLLDDATKAAGAGFPEKGLAVMLLGPGLDAASCRDMAGSEYLDVIHGITAGQPSIDLELERRVQKTCREGIAQRIVRSAHDCSDGGLAVALAECCILGGVGFRFRGALESLPRWDAALFGEAQSRIIVSVEQERISLLEDLARANGSPVSVIGFTGGDALQLDSYDAAGADTGNGIELAVSELTGAWANALEDACG